MGYFSLLMPLAIVCIAWYFINEGEKSREKINKEGVETVAVCTKYSAYKGHSTSYKFWVDGKEYFDYDAIPVSDVKSLPFYPVGRMFLLKYLKDDISRSLIQLDYPVDELQQFGDTTLAVIHSSKFDNLKKYWLVKFSYMVNGKQVTETKRYSKIHTLESYPKIDSFNLPLNEPVKLIYSKFRLGKNLPPMSEFTSMYERHNR